jgi:hypothetical protein
MDLDTMLTEAAPSRHLPLDGPESPAAVRLYQQITAQPPASGRASRRRRFARTALIGVAAAAVAAAMALALVPGSPAGRRGGQGGVTLAAWSVIKEQHGLVKVTIRELRDPAGLWQALREDGVPANVRFLHHDFVPTTSAHDLPKGCLAPRMSDAANAGLQEKIMPGAGPQNGVVLKIRPSAIPHGIGLYLKAWAASPGANGGLSLQTDLVQATPQCTG